ENKIIKLLENKKINYQLIDEGIVKLNNQELQFVNNSFSNNENNDSLVVKMKIKGYNILLTGDIDSFTERELINQFSQVDILKIAHHGSKYSTSDDFLEIVKPRISLISAR